MAADLPALIAAAEFFADPVFPEDSYREWLLRGMLARLGDDGRMACVVHVSPVTLVLRGNMWLAVAFDLDDNIRAAGGGRHAFTGYISKGSITGAEIDPGVNGIPVKVGVARLQIGKPDAQPEVVGYEICELRNVGWGARQWRPKA